MRIFIVDDNPDVIDAIVDHFSVYECSCANDAKTASERLAKDNFDLVITDITMKGGGGERILMEMSCKDTPVIVFTGKKEEEFSKYYKLGAEEVISKLRPAELISTVRKYVLMNDAD